MQTGDIIAAIASARRQGYLGGSMMGLRPPLRPSGARVFSHWEQPDAKTLTVTSGRLYAAPFYQDQQQAYSGMACMDSGAGNNGQKARMGIATDVGGPGSLVIDTGEITFAGAAAEHTAASAFTLQADTWYWKLMLFNSGTVMQTAGGGYIASAVGLYPVVPALIGLLGSGQLANGGGNQWAIGGYVAQVYGALPSTIPALTNPIFSNNASTTGGNFPAFCPYV